VSFAQGLVVRALRGAAAFAAFFLFGRAAPELFEASGSLVVDGKAPIVVSTFDEDASRAGAARDAALARVAELAARPPEAPAAAAAASARAAPLDRLAEFVVLHPELSQDLARPAPSKSKSSETDRIRLERERDRVRADIAAVARGVAPQASADDSDNPFGEGMAAPAPPNDRRLRLRLAEIDASLAALAKAQQPAEAPSLHGELAVLLAAVPPADALGSVPPPPTPRLSELKGSVVPREPDRRSLLALGLLAALAVALLPTTRRATRSADALDDIVPGASRGLAPSPLPTFAADELGPEPPPARSVASAAVESTAYPPVVPTPPAPGPRAAAAYEDAVVASARPRSSPPTGESPVMAYPVPWRAESVVGRDRFPDLRKSFLGEAARDCFVVAISATLPASGSRAEVAAGLSASFAADPTARVLAVEADLGAPALGQALGLEVMPAADFGKQLGARIEGSADGHWYVLKCSPALHVLAAKVEAPELVLSTHFEDCVAALRPFYDVIILRAPAVSDTVACRAVSDVVDGVVVLVSASENSDVQAGASALSLFGQKRLSLELRI
jgi:Mrp family chromosome partitioning ATPase